MIKSIDEAVKIPTIKLDIMKKFESRKQILSPPSNPLVKIDTPCMVCRGHIKEGYIIFNAQNVKLDYKVSTKAHIVAHLLYVGPRNNQQVQHLCGVTHCANYTHLCLGGHKQNGQHASMTRAKTDHSKKSWKLSEPDKNKIIELHWIHGYTISFLAEMYDVHVSTIRRTTTFV